MISEQATDPTVHDHNGDYHELLAAVRQAFEVSHQGGPLFTTDAKDLNDLYLDSLPAERQIHNCAACRHFIQRYGGLVAINDAGVTIPVLWDERAAPAFYQSTLGALEQRVGKARVTGVFKTSLPVWGTPETGEWSHLAVTPPKEMVTTGGALSAGQLSAALRQSFITLNLALRDFTPEVIDETLRILRAGKLHQSTKFGAPLTWLRALYDRPKGLRGENVLWRAVATAPEGYCHVRASVSGALLVDVAAGLSFAEIQRRHNAKVEPLRYQRPQVAPTAGNVKQAEDLVAKLGIAPALERRFARLEDLQTIWKPAPAPEPVETAGGVFGHLVTKGEEARTVKPVEIGAVTMTWVKFRDTVLPGAEAIDILVPRHGQFIAFTTAEHEDAPPILKWGNPVAWYVYPGGSDAATWDLTPNAWAPLTAIAPLPTLWGEKPMAHLGEGVVAVIQGAVDQRDSGNALFPECLANELHGVRATIEAYAGKAKLGGREGASACGYDLRASSTDCHLRVKERGAWTTYHLDRWD